MPYYVAVFAFSTACALTLGFVAEVCRPQVRGIAFCISSVIAAIPLSIAIFLLPLVLKGS